MLHRFIAPVLAAGLVVVVPTAESGSPGGEIVFARSGASQPEVELFALPLGGASRRLSGDVLDRPSLVSVSPDGRNVVLLSSRSGTSNLFLVRVDGTSARWIARNVPSLRFASAASWSPDARQLAFGSNSDPAAVHIVRMDGTGRRRLVGGAFDPRWSPDGSRIAVGTGRDGHILVLRPDGRRLWRTPGSAAVWSPDGSFLAVTRGLQVKRQRVVVLDASGATRASVAGSLAAWAPDGTRLALTRDRNDSAGSAGVVVFDLRAGRSTRVGRGSGPLWSPRGHLTFAGDGSVWVLDPGARIARRAFRGSPLGFSPDARQLAGRRLISRGGTASAQDEIWMADASGEGASRVLVAPRGTSLSGVRWAGSGTLIYERRREFVDSDLYAVAHDGAGLRQLTNAPWFDSNPDWSPDGRAVVFERSSEPFDAELRGGFSMSLWTISAGGGTATRLTTAASNDWFPDWSPDGQRVVFARYEYDPHLYNVRPRLHIVDAGAGRQPGRIQTPWDATAPSWSPDGKLIAYVRGLVTGKATAVIAPDGSGRRTLISSVQDDLGYPAWAPDGQSIAYVDGESVFVARADGTHIRRVTRGSAPLAWSPDGTRLVFTDDRCVSTVCANLWSIALDGSDRRRLTQAEGTDSEPDWRP